MGRLISFILLIALLWAAGLGFYIRKLPDPARQDPEPAQGIVVFTGSHGVRVAAGMALLDRKLAERLLISGVNPATPREEIIKLWPGDPAVFECCVDLGLEARTTVGNAAELRDWIDANGFKSLILVTAEYHMPRALLETASQVPDVIVQPYPVSSGLVGPNGFPLSVADWRRLAAEYSKFLAVYGKTLLANLR